MRMTETEEKLLSIMDEIEEGKGDYKLLPGVQVALALLQQERKRADVKRADDSQTAKADNGKLDLTLVPTQAIKDIAEVRMYGNKKYPDGGPNNWREVGARRFAAALFRHLLAYLDDPKSKDDESGINHYKHLICNAAFICELERERSEK